MADQRIQSSEEMVGAGHASKSDTLNRLALIEHTTDGYHKYYEAVPITAGMMIPSESDGPETGTYEVPANNWNIDYMSFSANSEQAAHFGFPAPQWWDGTFKVKVYCVPASGGGSAEDEIMSWAVSMRGISDSEVLSGGFGTAVFAMAEVRSGTSAIMHVSSQSAQGTCADLETDDWVRGKIVRAVSSGDDMAGNAWLLGIKLQLYRDQQEASW